MKRLLLGIVISTFGISAAVAGEAKLYVPISGDSGKTIAQLNRSLSEQNISERLPKFALITSEMSQEEVQRYVSHLSDLADKASEFQSIEISGAYGYEVEGRSPCFEGDISKMQRIYENMVDSLLSDQFTILAVSVRNPASFGVKYDESDSGNEGTWINIKRCK